MESPPPPLPLSYATVPTRDRSLAWPYHLLLGAVVVVSLVVLLGSLFVIPRFVDIFKDFKTELPMITKVVLDLCWWLGPGWGWCIALLLAMAIVAIGIVIDAGAVEVSRFRRYAICMTIVLLLADTLWPALVVFALFAPIFNLLHAASGPAR